MIGWPDFLKLSTAPVRIMHRNTQSVGAKGGVYLALGRNQHELMTRAYWEFLLVRRCPYNRGYI